MVLVIHYSISMHLLIAKSSSVDESEVMHATVVQT